MWLSNLIPNKLTVRAQVATIIVILLFLGSSLSSGFLAWAAQNDAKAINTAGSIRMAAYRFNFLLASDFDPSNLGLQANPSDKDSLGFKDSLGAKVGSVADPTGPTAADKEQRLNTLINDMNRRHQLLHQYQNQLANRNERIDRQIKRIEQRWQNELLPLLLNNDAQGFYKASLPYVQQVDAVVSQLQYRNERRQSQQQLFQLFFLGLMVLVMLAVIAELRKKALAPIQNLVKAKESFKSGQLDTRVAIKGYSEFEELGLSFNDMVSTIEKNHLYLESEVQSKTAHLTQANQVLALLYDFAKYLTTSQVSIVELNRLIADFGKIIPDLEFTLCLKNDLLDNQDAIAIHSSALRELCSTSTCDSCLIKTNAYTESFDIRHQKYQYGELRVRPKSLGISQSLNISRPTAETPITDNIAPSDFLKQGAAPNSRIPLIEELNAFSESEQLPEAEQIATKALISDNKEAIVALTNLISTAMFLLHQRQHEHQIILLEERATIARELHDSLAQSLSYLKIQVTILEKRLNHTHCDSPDLVLVTDSILKIKEGLTSAYQHLRDLLVTFRLSLNDDSFDEALHNSADEFAKKGGFNIKVTNQVMSLNLNASEQVNVIQIVREALSNICRHAEANNVEVSYVYIADSDDTLLTISDDGKGISGNFDHTHHHGLMIMQERAKSLGGTLKITQNHPKGTTIEARFAPAFFTN